MSNRFSGGRSAVAKIHSVGAQRGPSVLFASVVIVKRCNVLHAKEYGLFLGCWLVFTASACPSGHNCAHKEE